MTGCTQERRRARAVRRNQTHDRSARATSEIGKARGLHPERKRSSPTRPGRREPGDCLVRVCPESMTADSVCARGPTHTNAAPAGAGRRPRGTERVISPAPFLRGVPAEGVAGDGNAAPAQGKAFPSRLISSLFLPGRVPAPLAKDSRVSFSRVSHGIRSGRLIGRTTARVTRIGLPLAMSGANRAIDRSISWSV